MTKQCKKLLNLLNELAESKEQILYLDNHHKNILNKNHASKSLFDLSDEIEGLLQLLVDDGYIVYDIPRNFPDGEFCLTHRGLHWKQILHKKILVYLLKSVLVPIIVSLFTTMLTIYLTTIFH